MSLQQLPAVLSRDELERLRSRLEDARWVDGRETAGVEAARIKHNLQLEQGSPAQAESTELVRNALQACEPFKQLVLPRRMSMPLFSRYDAGMQYGPHTDDAYRSREQLRTDIAVTLFLSEPDSYEGGELLVEGAAIKLAAGSLVAYPASTIHRVAKVTRGRRLVCVFWIQSLVRDAAQREILHGLHGLSSRLDPSSALQLARVQQNLLRMWLEP